MKKQDKKQENFCSSEVRQYREKIIEMVGQIEDEKYLKMIYGFINRIHKE